MHVSKVDLEPTVIGEYEGRSVDAGGFRIAFESMTAHSGGEKHEVVRAGEAYHLRPGHFVQTLEPVELIELSPIDEHDRTMAVVARNMGAVMTG
jgi:hypothetical protein